MNVFYSIIILLILFSTSCNGLDIHSKLLFESESNLKEQFNQLAEYIEKKDVKNIYSFADEVFKKEIKINDFTKSINDFKGHKISLIDFMPIYYGDLNSTETGDLYCVLIVKERSPKLLIDGKISKRSAEYHHYMVWTYNLEKRQWSYLTFPFVFAYLPENLKFYGFRAKEQQSSKSNSDWTEDPFLKTFQDSLGN